MKRNKRHLKIGALLLCSYLLACDATARENVNVSSPELDKHEQHRIRTLLVEAPKGGAASVTQCARKFDEYGNIRGNDTKARLDNFAVQLQNERDAKGYMIFYGPRRGRAGTVQRRMFGERGYLLNARGIEPGRLIVLIAGLKET